MPAEQTWHDGVGDLVRQVGVVVLAVLAGRMDGDAEHAVVIVRQQCRERLRKDVDEL